MSLLVCDWVCGHFDIFIGRYGADLLFGPYAGSGPSAACDLITDALIQRVLNRAVSSDVWEVDCNGMEAIRTRGSRPQFCPDRVLSPSRLSAT